MENTYNYVREVRREDGVTIRLHFSSGSVTLQECMVRILEKHIENHRKVENLDSICYNNIANTVSYLFGRKEKI